MTGATSNILRDCSYRALLVGAKRVSPLVHYDDQGYAPSWRANLLAGLPLEEIEQDFGKGAGHELERKLCAAHSSAALAVNTFGPLRASPTSLLINGISGFHSMRFEATCPIWANRTPPHLDVLLEGDALIAVESKCTEWMTPKLPIFSERYEQLRPSNRQSAWAPWFEEMLSLRGRSQFFDAAQVIKHAFGLLKRYETKRVQLVYVYWEPRNAEDWPECFDHRRQADDLAARVEQSTVQLVPMSYQELWGKMRGSSVQHMQYLRERYDLQVVRNFS